jgi:hypothetical protein
MGLHGLVQGSFYFSFYVIVQVTSKYKLYPSLTLLVHKVDGGFRIELAISTNQTCAYSHWPTVKYCDTMAESQNSGTKERQLLLCSGTVNTFLQQLTNMQQQRNNGGSVFYAVCTEAI